MADIIGTTSYTPPAVAIARKGDRIGLAVVTESDPSPGSPPLVGTMLGMPNMRLMSVAEREFIPKMARYRYAFAPATNPPGSPQRVEQVYPFKATGRYVVKTDDLLWAVKFLPNKKFQTIAFGFAQVPEANLGESTETCGFSVAGIEFRHWDRPMRGAIYRDSDGYQWTTSTPLGNPDPTKPQDTQTDLPIRFNPDGKFNATPKNHDSDMTGFTGGYAAFVTPVDDPEQGERQWTLAMAVRYILSTEDARSTQYLMPLGNLSYLDDLFTSVAPAEGFEFIDWTNPDSFTLEDIIVPDIDVTGDVWPNALRRLIEPHGFGFKFELQSVQPPLLPRNILKIYRKDDPINNKPVFLQSALKGCQDYDPALSNVLAMQLARDSMAIENVWAVSSEIKRVEASFILDPLFFPDNPPIPANYIEGSPTFPGNEKKFRWFGVDEDGAGHFNLVTRLFVNNVIPPTMSLVLQPGAKGSDARTFVHRPRKPRRELISVDANGDKMHAQLWISYDYPTGGGVWNPKYPVPKIDPTTGKQMVDPITKQPIFTPGGTWTQVTNSGWKLLDDEIGIQFTGKDPTNWPIGGGPQVPGSLGQGAVVNLVQAFGSPAPGATPNSQFVFRLTCVIDTDNDMDIESLRRQVSPTKFKIKRYDDCRDRFQLHAISPNSNLNTFGFWTYPVDDRDEAQDHCDSRRKANELTTHSGSVNFGYYNPAYGISDKITRVKGRNISLNMNAGSTLGETPVHPVIVGRDHVFEPEQGTVIQLEDLRAEPPPERRRNDHQGRNDFDSFGD